ncbi:hypothetical protein LCGC14_0835730 [marine sediment metagenome]|uniref:Uncharacterized protein n=1 Tax=marine sediment metagenome TaxID=412755 RepID=A0A0F9SLU7_9ZZZZ
MKSTTKTLKELGPNLPHGIVGTDGKLHCGFGIKPWRGREEREIAKLRSQARGNPADFPAKLLGFMFTQVGQFDFEQKSKEEKSLLISQMLSGDVLYMYIYLRYLCIGNKVRMTVTCEHCGRGFPFTGDLETLEVKCIEAPADAEWTYELSDPLTLRGEKISGLDMVPMSWSTMENSIRSGSKDGADPVSTKMDVMRGCIFGKQGGDKAKRSAYSVEDLDDMTKRDIERLTAHIEGNAIGPDMRVSDICPACARTFVHNLEWAFDDFFGSSSQPLPEKIS